MQTLSYIFHIIKCPYCVKNERSGSGKDSGQLTLENECWLVCRTCERKYPLRDLMPVMFLEEGDKWIKTPVTGLPVPPP